MAENSNKVVSENRKAGFEYFLTDFYEAGIVLVGTEIKSIRKHSVNISDSYIAIRNNEAYIYNMNIAVYEEGNIFNHDPLRVRKLLLHKQEINKLAKKVKEDGYTLIPTKLILVKGRAKLVFALAKGKHNYDKREDMKKKSIEKETRKLSKERY